VDFVKLSGTADFYSSQVYFYLGLFLLYGKMTSYELKKPTGQEHPAAEWIMLRLKPTTGAFLCDG
jgi:hypothetical protein